MRFGDGVRSSLFGDGDRSVMMIVKANTQTLFNCLHEAVGPNYSWWTEEENYSIPGEGGDSGGGKSTMTFIPLPNLNYVTPKY